MIIGSKNKGDWGEFYALVYLLGTQKLYASDSKLKRLASYYFPILKIERDEGENRHIDFVVDNNNALIEIYYNSKLVRKMTPQEFITEAELLCRDIPSASGRSFDIDHGEKFLNDIYCSRLSADSTDITDITMEVHDIHTGTDQKIGFSVKSYLGGAPTLLNASGATNFIYVISGLNESAIDEINSIETKTKIKDRINAIYKYGGTFNYLETQSDVFSGNLLMIDSQMELILSKMLLKFYTGEANKCVDLINILEEENPLHFQRKGVYEYKFKEFLCAKALGMEPGREWNGVDDANGGYVVVKSDGDVVAFHLYERNSFKAYLFENTFFEKASSTKHGFATIYLDDFGRTFMKLNLQIRFLQR